MGYEGILQRCAAHARHVKAAIGPLRDFTSSLPFPAEVFLLADAAARQQVTVVAKATYAIVRERLEPAEDPAPIRLFPEPWDDGPTSSLRHESDAVPWKPAADVLLLGTVEPRRGRATERDVALRVGAVTRLARVFGDRRWSASRGAVVLGPPEEFERMPLVPERAYGGSHAGPDGGAPVVFAPNPIGRGFLPIGAAPADVDGALAPNVEDPACLVASPDDRPTPALFGVLSPHFAPRLEHLGTFDEAWAERRSPHLPVDFDPRFWNVAPPALRLASLEGGQRVEVEGVRPDGALRFALPRLAVTARVRLAGDAPVELALRADTLVVDADARRVEIVLRASLDVHGRTLDLAGLEVGFAGSSAATEGHGLA
jgi:hypothetical protein